MQSTRLNPVAECLVKASHVQYIRSFNLKFVAMTHMFFVTFNILMVFEIRLFDLKFVTTTHFNGIFSKKKIKIGHCQLVRMHFSPWALYTFQQTE